MSAKATTQEMSAVDCFAAVGGAITVGDRIYHTPGSIFTDRLLRNEENAHTKRCVFEKRLTTFSWIDRCRQRLLLGYLALRNQAFGIGHGGMVSPVTSSSKSK